MRLDIELAPASWSQGCGSGSDGRGLEHGPGHWRHGHGLGFRKRAEIQSGGEEWTGMPPMPPGVVSDSRLKIWKGEGGELGMSHVGLGCRHQELCPLLLAAHETLGELELQDVGRFYKTVLRNAGG